MYRMTLVWHHVNLGGPNKANQLRVQDGNPRIETR